MYRQQSQGQTERSYGEVHCTQRLYLLQLQISDQPPGAVCCCPWNLSSGRRVEGHVEVRARIESRNVSVPCFHLASSRNQVYKKRRVFAGNQQRLKKGSRLGIHESAWVTSNKRVTSSATIKMCLNLPAERRKGKERG